MRLSPDIKESFKHHDYFANPTIASASGLIDKFAEDNLSESTDIERCIDYITKRPKPNVWQALTACGVTVTSRHPLWMSCG